MYEKGRMHTYNDVHIVSIFHASCLEIANFSFSKVSVSDLLIVSHLKVYIYCCCCFVDFEAFICFALGKWFCTYAIIKFMISINSDFLKLILFWK